MNNQIKKLFEIGGQKKRIILGLMSGTSLDGLDMALCEIEGSGHLSAIRLLHFKTIAYDNQFRDELRKIFARSEGRLEDVCLLNKKIGFEHARMVNETISCWGLTANDIDLIASHGQTVYHSPLAGRNNKSIGNASLQIGDGDQIAYHTKIITVCDFRQKHIAAGGEGAPLAVYGDFLMNQEKDKDIFLINIGGISNYTYIPANAAFEQLISSDIGPGNTLMNVWSELKLGKPFDPNGEMASSGTVQKVLLELLLKNTFFDQEMPASTGPESFSVEWLMRCIEKTEMTIKDEDVMATLSRFTAEAILKAIERLYRKDLPSSVQFSGGGIHNGFLMKYLHEQIEQHFPKLRINSLQYPDAKEAMIFAMLANECVTGNPAVSFGTGSRHAPSVSFGKICLPG